MLKTGSLWSSLKVFIGIRKKNEKRKKNFDMEKKKFGPLKFPIYLVNSFSRGHNFFLYDLVVTGCFVIHDYM